MRGTLPAVSALLLSVAILLVGNGLQGTLIGVRAGIEQFAASELGVVAAFYYLGFSVGCLTGSWFINRVGHIRTFAVLASIASASALVHTIYVTPLSWALLRAVTGLCLAGLYMVIESWLNGRVDNRQRGALLAVYMIVNYGGSAAGQQLLRIADPGSFELFVVSSVLISLALVPVALTTSVAPAPVVTGRLNLVKLYRLSPLGTLTTFGAGLANAAFWGLAPLYALEVGLDTGGIATFMSVIILGGIGLQWPVGRLSDRFDRRRVIAVATLALALVSVALFIVGSGDWTILLAGGFVFGGFSLTLYSLAVAHTNDHTGDLDLVQVSAGLLLMFGAGSVIGPILGGYAMHLWGPGALFAYVAAVSFAMTLYALWRMLRREPVPLDDQTSFVAVPPTAGAAALDPRTEIEPFEAAFAERQATAEAPAAPGGAVPGELIDETVLHDDGASSNR